MPSAQLFSATIEKVMNTVIRLDPGVDAKLKPLAGKSMQVRILELPWPLRFCFSDRIDVITVADQGNTPVSSDEVQTADCSIALSLSVLPDLKDASQLSALIKQDKLALEGDIHVAQAFSQLLMQLDIDLEDLLSEYVGDVTAHTVFSGFRQVADNFKRSGERIRTMLSEGLIEEKQLAAPAIAVTHFCDQVDTLRSDVGRLEARLAILEKAAQTKANTHLKQEQ